MLNFHHSNKIIGFWANK